MTSCNLTIHSVHAYYVVAGDTPVLVHNNSCDVELGPGVDSADALRAWSSGKPETEFIYDPNTGQFLAGDREPPVTHNSGPSLHEQLVAQMGTDPKTIVGGTMYRDEGQLVFTQSSGHFGQNWKPAILDQFQEFVSNYGIQAEYKPWGSLMGSWKPVVQSSYDSWLGVLPSGELGVGKFDEGRVSLKESGYVVAWPFLELGLRDVVDRFRESWSCLSTGGETSPEALVERIVLSAWRSGRAYWMRLSADWVCQMVRTGDFNLELLLGILREASRSEVLTQEARLQAQAVLASIA